MARILRAARERARDAAGHARVDGRLCGNLVSMGEHLADGSLAGALGQLRMPAIFLLGAQSPMALRQGEQAAVLLPGSEVVIVPAAGHLPWHEQPGCVASALSRIRSRAGDLEPAG